MTVGGETRGEGETLETVADVADVPEGTLLGVRTAAGEEVCLFNYQGRIGAVHNVCTHAEFPLSDGTLTNDGTIECVWHGARYSCLTGEVRRGPAIDPVAVYEVRVEDGKVLVGGRGGMSGGVEKSEPKRARREGRAETGEPRTTLETRGAPPAKQFRASAPAECHPSLAPRSDFPLLAASPSLHYLDSAATSQKPRVVLEAMREFYEHDYANPHRGAYALSVRATDRYREARERVARFVGIADAARLIFTRGTTEGPNLVATAWGTDHVSRGDEIVVTALEHHANFVPWQQLAIKRGAALKICGLTSDGRLDLDVLASLITTRTRIVAVNHVSNALGTLNPVAEIAALVRRRAARGAIVVCDGAQAAPHLRLVLDGAELGDVDFYAFSGHKMLGPMGIGGLVGRRALLETMSPYQMGGDMIEIVGDEETTWNVLPHKFEAGTPNVADAVGLAAACTYLDSLGMDTVRSHELALLEYAVTRLASIEGLTLYGPGDAAQRSGVVSFTLAGVHPHDIATILDGEGVCVRAGHHCAQPLMRRLEVPATARASFYVYNDEGDVEALVNAVEKTKSLFTVD